MPLHRRISEDMCPLIMVHCSSIYHTPRLASPFCCLRRSHHHPLNGHRSSHAAALPFGSSIGPGRRSLTRRDLAVCFQRCSVPGPSPCISPIPSNLCGRDGWIRKHTRANTNHCSNLMTVKRPDIASLPSLYRLLSISRSSLLIALLGSMRPSGGSSLYHLCARYVDTWAQLRASGYSRASAPTSVRCSVSQHRPGM
ncbi:uncharacterized protein BDZ99DRAFT_305543 [Mytilinidion resinicola]|uniref:Uncharacterized protein n=1 Tax=Mytilinidion resinicola TaxID=574789 RepID=A0A6A6YMN5_9PEZI|nr:uncharacterized protein BDZ99DRAFT_305543 [Mytilinidion resinicola]KAF2810142.1 hypothetical protein BDZ99DRAFT_305543 [Mytilinidion resinicola]